MNRTCPYCQHTFFLKGEKRKKLLKSESLIMRCYGCEKSFEIQREDMSVYRRYEGKKERIGGIVEVV